MPDFDRFGSATQTGAPAKPARPDDGADERHLRRLIWWSALVAFLITLGYSERASAGKPAPDSVYHYSLFANGLIEYAILLTLVLRIANRRWDLLALRRPQSWGQAARLSIGVFIPVYIVTYILDLFLHAGREQGITPTRWEGNHAGAFAASFFVIAVVAPIVEELTFRGLGFSLLRPYGTWLAVVVVGLTFGLAHGLVNGLPELAIFGGALAWIRARTDSVYPGMMIHTLFNSLGLVLSVTTHHA